MSDWVEHYENDWIDLDAYKLLTTYANSLVTAFCSSLGGDAHNEALVYPFF